MRILLILMSMLLTCNAWATIPAKQVPVTKTSVPWTLQTGSITDTGTQSGPGNVGINQTNPQSTLDVGGTVNASTSMTSPLIVAGTGGAYIGNTNGGVNFGISPTSGYVPQAQLDVNGDMRATNAGIGASSVGVLFGVGGYAVGHTGKAACIGAGPNGPCLGEASGGTYPNATCTCL